jgi:uncharacterized membrane protein
MGKIKQHAKEILVDLIILMGIIFGIYVFSLALLPSGEVQFFAIPLALVSLIGFGIWVPIHIVLSSSRRVCEEAMRKPRQAIPLSLKFYCPHCGQKLEAKKDMIGAVVKCPVCEKSTKASLDN